MKTLTVELTEDVYERAERRAEMNGAALSQQVKLWIRQFADATEPSPAAQQPDLTRLFAALDKAHNVTPIGPLCRDELHDRDVLR